MVTDIVFLIPRNVSLCKMAWIISKQGGGNVIVKPHHKEDIFVITRGGAEAEV